VHKIIAPKQHANLQHKRTNIKSIKTTENNKNTSKIIPKMKVINFFIHIIVTQNIMTASLKVFDMQYLIQLSGLTVMSQTLDTVLIHC